MKQAGTGSGSLEPRSRRSHRRRRLGSLHAHSPCSGFARLRALLLLVLILLWISPDAATEAAAASADRVVILVSAKVDVYRETVRGFKDSFEHNIVAEYNMNGDIDRGREILAEIERDVKPDLVLVVGVWALQAVVQETLEIPVVYAMVLNPVTIVGENPQNITGASMNVPVERTLEALKELGPGIRRVGTIYNPANTGYLVERAHEIASKAGFELVLREVRSTGEAVAGLDSLQEEGIDALWIVPDATVLAKPVVERMLLTSYHNGVPLLGLSSRHANMGALLTLSFASSEDIGRQAGELANQTLAQKSASGIPFTMARQVNLTVNLKTAKKLGIEIPGNVLARAQAVIR